MLHRPSGTALRWVPSSRLILGGRSLLNQLMRRSCRERPRRRRRETRRARRPAVAAAWPGSARSISSTMRLPMTTASAKRAMARAVCGSRMPKPTPTGTVVRARMRTSMRSTSAVSMVRRARHALERHVIDVALRHARDEVDARLRRRGRKQEDRIDAGRREGLGPRAAFLGGVVDDKDAIHARFLAREAKFAAPMCSIGFAYPISTIGVRSSSPRYCFTASRTFAEPRSRAKRTLRGALDGRAVRHRVGKGNAQLDHVRPVSDEGAEDVEGMGGRRVARRDERHERRAALGAKPVEGGGDAAHRIFHGMVEERADIRN